MISRKERPRPWGNGRGRGDITGSDSSGTKSSRGAPVTPFPRFPQRWRSGLYSISERVAVWRRTGSDPYAPWSWRRWS